MYKITNYTYKKAKELNIIIKPSTKKNKKIDIYDINNKFMFSIGDINYYDDPTYLNIDKQKAEKRKALFYKRFNNIIPFSKTYYSAKLLW